MKNLRRFVCKTDLDQSERTKVSAESEVDPSLHLAPTYESVWPGLLMLSHSRTGFTISSNEMEVIILNRPSVQLFFYCCCPRS